MGGVRWRGALSSYVHEILHLLPLHAALQLALLRLVKPEVIVSWIMGEACL